jgi:hypothetical protein
MNDLLALTDPSSSFSSMVATSPLDLNYHKRSSFMLTSSILGSDEDERLISLILPFSPSQASSCSISTFDTPMLSSSATAFLIDTSQFLEMHAKPLLFTPKLGSSSPKGMSPNTVSVPTPPRLKSLGAKKANLSVKKWAVSEFTFYSLCHHAESCRNSKLSVHVSTQKSTHHGHRLRLFQ